MKVGCQRVPVQSLFRSHPPPMARSGMGGMGGRGVSRKFDAERPSKSAEVWSFYLTALELSDVAYDHYCNCTPLSQSNSSGKLSQKAKSSGQQLIRRLLDATGRYKQLQVIYRNRAE